MSELRLSSLVIAEADTRKGMATLIREAADMIEHGRSDKSQVRTEIGDYRFNIQKASDVKQRAGDKK